MDVVELIRQPLHGLKELSEVEVERHDPAGREPVPHPEIEDQGDGRDVDEGDERAVDAEADHDLEDRTAVAVVLLVELLAFLFLTVEYLRDLHAREILVQKRVEVGQPFPLFAEGAALVDREKERGDEDHRDRDQHQKREFPADEEHDGVDPDDGDEVPDDRNDHVGKQVAHRLGVRGDPRHETAYRHLGELILTHPLDVGEHVGPQGVDDALPRLLERHGFDVDEQVVEYPDEERADREHNDRAKVDQFLGQTVGDARNDQRDHDVERDVEQQEEARENERPDLRAHVGEHPFEQDADGDLLIAF